MLHKALPTAVLLHKKEIPVDLLCGFRHQSEETCSHLFRDCPFTRRLWDCHPWPFSIPLDLDRPFEVWFLELVSKLGSIKNWGVLDCIFGLFWDV